MQEQAISVSTYIDERRGTILRTVSGEFSKEEILAELDADVNRPDFRPGLNALWDFAEVDIEEFPSEDIQELSKAISNRMEGRGEDFKSAIVVSDDLV